PSPRQRGPQLGGCGEYAPARHDADDRPGAADEGDRPAEDRGVAVEACSPEPIAQDDDAIVARLILFRSEPAPQCWLHAQHREEGCAGACARNARGVAAAAQRQLLALVAGDALEAQVVAPILEIQAVVEAGRQLEWQVGREVRDGI